MKPQVNFFLETAGWPALLVESPGVIRRANAAAVGVFGARVKGGACPLANIWSESNTITPEELLLRAFETDGSAADLQLRLKNGFTDAFLTRICPVERDGQRYFALQFFKGVLPAAGAAPPGAPTPGPPERPAASASGESIGTPVQRMADLAAGAPPEDGTIHRQKVDSALQLTRTVALDFNNALTSILGHTSLVLSKMEAGHPWRNSLLEVEKAAGKAAEIAHDLAEFSRQEKDTRGHDEGNLNELLRRSVALFRSSAPKEVDWKLHLESRLCATRFDEAKMQQALVKLLENAVEAVGQAGRIVVLSRNRDITEPTQDGLVKLAPGCYVCAEISDSGPGIAPAALPRIFEPFFTTKAGHRGLGLPLVYGIIANHGGSVAVSSQPGSGTTVRVYLPAQRKFVRDRIYRDEELRGRETILIVDDEDLLLTMCQMILSSYGYRALTANSGQKALEIMDKPDSRVNLVLTDLVMPGMSGRELIERLKLSYPQLPIIYMTGYTHPVTKAGENCLQKPFTSQSLLSKVKETLNADAES